MKILGLSLCFTLIALVSAPSQQAPNVLSSSTTPSANESAIPTGVSIQEICAVSNGIETACKPCIPIEAPACPDGRTSVRFTWPRKAEIVKFVADIRGELPPGAYVRWSVTGGTILENVNEDQITVSTDPQSGFGVVEAVVEIAGMADEAFNKVPAAPAKRKRLIESCPMISIELVKPIGGMINSGAPFVYRAKADGELPKDTVFEWTISIATIIDGQGTSVIKAVLSDKEFEEAMAANLVTTLTTKVPSLGNYCDREVTDAVVIESPPGPILIDEFSVPVTQIDKERLAKAAIEQRNNRTGRLYIIEYFPASVSDFEIREKLGSIRAFFVDEEQVMGSEFDVVHAVADEPITKIYRILPGGLIPKP